MSNSNSARLGTAVAGLALSLTLSGCGPTHGVDLGAVDQSNRPERATVHPTPPPAIAEDQPDVEEPARTPVTATYGTCVATGGSNSSDFQRATISKDAGHLMITFKFERPYAIEGREPNSISIQGPERLVAQVGPLHAYAFLSPDFEREVVNWAIRDAVLDGDIIAGATLVDDGDELVMSVPLPADLTPYANKTVNWRVEAQGVSCPLGNEDWLSSDVFMTDGG